MTPDVERLLVETLRADPDIVDIVGARGVHSVMPGSDAAKAGPFVVLHLIAAVPAFARPLWLESSRIQIDCYGGPKVLARQLADTVRDALADDAIVGVHDQGVVTGVEFGILTWLPDDRIDPPRPRYTVDVTVYAHPGEAVGS